MSIKPDTDYGEVTKPTTGYDDTAKSDTGYNRYPFNPAYNPTIYDSNNIYDVHLEYSGLVNGEPQFIVKPPTTYGNVTKPQTGYARP